MVNLSATQLTEDAVEHLSQLIISNPELYVNYNSIGKGVLHIAKALQNGACVKKLRMGYNSFPVEVCDELVLAYSIESMFRITVATIQ